MRSICCFIAEVVELVDTHVSGACVRKDMGVRVPPSAQKKTAQKAVFFFWPKRDEKFIPPIEVKSDGSTCYAHPSATAHQPSEE